MSDQTSFKLSRIAFATAAVLAIVSVGFSLSRTADRPSKPPSQASNASSSDRSVSSLEAAVAKDPNDIEALQALAWSRFEGGQYDQAADFYRKATKIEPQRASLWSSLGEAIVMGSERDPMPQEALAAFRTSVTRDPKDPRGRYFMAVARDLTGDHRGAISDWTALLNDTPPGAPWEADLRRTIVQVGQINKIDIAKQLAAADANRKTLIPPSSAIATAAIPGPTRADIQAASKLPRGQQEAMVASMVEGLEAKLQKDPSNVNGWIMLMRSRVTLGQSAKANDVLAKAIQANPNETQRLKEAADTLGIAQKNEL
jgi:cytochrome c-type biogenesis protein CcmH